MENNPINNSTNDEIQFYRKALLETTQISYGWMKTQKITVITFSIVITILFTICGVIVSEYLKFAYAPEGYEKANTNTNINQNINKNNE